ncbi:hypothetical protein EDB83DRAFT_2324942 [Lactarius deliciosus]|nr:hypothetical protein EDB83DRAFT_2324942 [Lactarius deliciosus]
MLKGCDALTVACMRQGGGPALCQGGVMAGLVVEGSCAVAVAIVFMVSMLPGRCHRRWALACHIGNGKVLHTVIGWRHNGACGQLVGMVMGLACHDSLALGQGFARQSGGGGLAYGEGWMEVAMTRWLCSINQKQYKYPAHCLWVFMTNIVGHAQWWVWGPRGGNDIIVTYVPAGSDVVVYLGVVDYGNSMERRDRTTRLWKHRDVMMVTVDIWQRWQVHLQKTGTIAGSCWRIAPACHRLCQQKIPMQLFEYKVDICLSPGMSTTLPMGKAETQVRLAKVVEPDVNALMAYVAIMPEYCQLEGMLVKALV